MPQSAKEKKPRPDWWDVKPIEPPEYYYRFWDNKSGCHLDKYRVHRRTEKGVWLCAQKSNGLQAFVLNVANKKWACPTIEAARVSFLARKKFQINHLKNKLTDVEYAVKCMNEGVLERFDTGPNAFHSEAGRMVLPEDKDKHVFSFDVDEPFR